MGKILVKQANVQQFQDIGAGGKRPSIARLARRTFLPGGTGEVGTEAGPNWKQRVGAGAGLLGKVGALAATGMQTANSLQGGNISAPFSAPLNYQGLDPTTSSNLGAMGFSQTAEQGLASSDNNMIQGPTVPSGYGSIQDSKLTRPEVSATQNPSPAIAGTQGNINPTTGEAVSVPLPTTPTPPATTPTPPAPAAPAPVAQPPAPVVGQSGPLNTALPNQAQTLGQIVGGQNVSGVPQPTTPPAPAPAAPAQQPAPAAPATAAPAPAPAAPATAQPNTGLFDPKYQSAAPAPAAPVAVTNRRNLQGEPLSPPMSAKVDARQAQMRAAGKTRPVSFSEETDAMYQDLGAAPPKPGLLERTQGVAPAQQPAPAAPAPVAQPPQPVQAPQPTTRENRAAMDEKIRRLGQNPEIARRAEELKKPVSVKPPMQTPPPPPPPIPPQVYKNPNEILGGSGELTPAPKRVGVEPDRTQAFTNLGPTKHTINNDYSYGGQPPMSGRDLLQGTGIAKPVNESPEWARMLDNEVSWQDNAPAPYQQKTPNEAAWAALETNPDRLSRNESKELGQGATITNTMGRGKERGISPASSSSDEAYNRAKELMAGQDKLNYSKNPFNKPFFDESRKAFVDMVFNEFGDLFHKADPHEVGSIIMGLYLDRVTG